jgi:hypothetical protein
MGATVHTYSEQTHRINESWKRLLLVKLRMEQKVAEHVIKKQTR